MRLKQVTDGRLHSPTNTVHDHHAAPVSVNFVNTSQSLPPGTTYNLDIPLPTGSYQFARAMLIGPNDSAGFAPWKECAEIMATRVTAEAVGHSVRNAGGFKKIYAATYSKQVGDSYLTHKIFNTGIQNYIAVQDAVIVGSALRITFKNYHGGSVTLNVRGQAILL